MTAQQRGSSKEAPAFRPWEEFTGVYREIVPPEREVHTFEFEGMPGHVILETSTLEEFEGKTKLTVTDLFQTVEDRDGMINSRMKEGATESMDRLEALLKKQK
ncbi:MAG: SRPBCC domain-containing protein [Methanothrix sp.]